MLPILGSAFQMSVPSPLTRKRAYEAFMRGPVSELTHFYGSVEAYRYGQQYLSGFVSFPEPQDSYGDDFGIVQSGEVRVAVAALPDVNVAGLVALKGAEVDLELVTRVEREDGSKVEFTNERRGLVKSVRRRPNIIELAIVDVDRSALDALYPSKRFAVADHPKLYVDHVGRAVPVIVGTALKVPLTYVDNTVGTYRYIVCELIGNAPTVLTLYRNGRIVSASEYTIDTPLITETTYLRVTFTKEQRDFNGSLYELTADILGPGSRVASDEIRRLLILAGAAVDGTSFDAAAAYGLTNGMLVDCPYVEQKRVVAIVQDLLQVARAQLCRLPSGAYGIIVDRPRDVRLTLDDHTDELQVEDYLEPDIAKTLTLEYRPSAHQAERFTGKLSRTTTGAVGEEVHKNPYIRDHVTADRWLCYMQRRLNARKVANAVIHGVHVLAGDLIAIRSDLTIGGGKIFAAPQISRPADQSSVELVEYDETVYTYSAGTLPADATSGYSPDYSQTPPAAPTGLQVVSQGQSADTDGKVTAYALIRAVPPAVNWARLMVLVTDTTTNEVYQAQLLLVGGNYEARVGGLRPNRTHTVVAWAVNSNNVDGITTAAANFTSANATTALAAPTVTVTQVQSKEVKVELSAVADVAGQPKLRRYILFESVGGAAYTEVKRSEERTFIRTVVHGTSYDYKARSEDVNGNESADSSVVGTTPAKMVDGGYIVDTSINRSRSSTSTGSSSGSFPFSSGRLHINMALYTFAPMIYTSNAQCEMVGGSSALGDDTGTVALRAYSTSDTYDVRWRYFVA